MWASAIQPLNIFSRYENLFCIHLGTLSIDYLYNEWYYLKEIFPLAFSSAFIWTGLSLGSTVFLWSMTLSWISLLSVSKIFLLSLVFFIFSEGGISFYLSYLASIELFESEDWYHQFNKLSTIFIVITAIFYMLSVRTQRCIKPYFSNLAYQKKIICILFYFIYNTFLYNMVGLCWVLRICWHQCC